MSYGIDTYGGGDTQEVVVVLALAAHVKRSP